MQVGNRRPPLADDDIAHQRQVAPGQRRLRFLREPIEADELQFGGRNPQRRAACLGGEERRGERVERLQIAVTQRLLKFGDGRE